MIVVEVKALTILNKSRPIIRLLGMRNTEGIKRLQFIIMDHDSYHSGLFKKSSHYHFLVEGYFSHSCLPIPSHLFLSPCTEVGQ